MDRVLEVASNISTPLALSGLIAAIFFLILKQILAKNIFPQLTRAVGGDIIKLVIERLFILALIAMVLGFAGYILTTAFPKEKKPADSITVNLPSGLTLRSAIKFLAQIDNFTADFKESCGDTVMNKEVEGGPLMGKSTVELIELLRLRLKDPLPRASYQVTKIPEKGIYEISCK
jgi:phosphotransferase system HPr-like phosphotransfer protein